MGSFSGSLVVCLCLSGVLCFHLIIWWAQMVDLDYWSILFLYEVKVQVLLIHMHMLTIFSQYHLLKRLSFLPDLISVYLSEISWLYMCGLISGISFCFISLYAYFYASTRLFWLKMSWNTSWSSVLCYFQLVFLYEF